VYALRDPMIGCWSNPIGCDDEESSSVLAHELTIRPSAESCGVVAGGDHSCGIAADNSKESAARLVFVANGVNACGVC